MIRKASIIIIAVVTVVLIAWDIFAYLTEKNSTFSVILTDWSWYSPWVPFVFGVLMGHWWFPAKGSKYDHVE